MQVSMTLHTGLLIICSSGALTLISLTSLAIVSITLKCRTGKEVRNPAKVSCSVEGRQVRGLQSSQEELIVCQPGLELTKTTSTIALQRKNKSK
jgi:hypothetical protein